MHYLYANPPRVCHCNRNAEGCTPFMQAMCQRAYPAALYLLDTAKRIATGRERIDVVDTELLMSMLFPPGSSLDNSPLHILCCNDMCSFTWTGDEHINQVFSHCFQFCGHAAFFTASQKTVNSCPYLHRVLVYF